MEVLKFIRSVFRWLRRDADCLSIRIKELLSLLFKDVSVRWLCKLARADVEYFILGLSRLELRGFCRRTA